MIKKLSDYEAYLKTLLETGCPLTAEQLLSVRTHIGFFQHERLAHEIVLVLFALLTVGGFLFFAACPDIPVLILSALFLVLLVPYINHYYGLENGVQRLYDLYAELENL